MQLFNAVTASELRLKRADYDFTSFSVVIMIRL